MDIFRKMNYEYWTNKLRKVINHNPNNKIISISNVDYYQYWMEGPWAIVKYEDDTLYEVSCDSVENGVLSWYFNINTENGLAPDDDLKSYINANIF